MKKGQKEQLDEVMRALLKLDNPPNTDTPKPTAEDLERRFTIRVGKDGKPSMVEVKEQK